MFAPSADEDDDDDDELLTYFIVEHLRDMANAGTQDKCMLQFQCTGYIVKKFGVTNSKTNS